MVATLEDLQREIAKQPPRTFGHPAVEVRVAERTERVVHGTVKAAQALRVEPMVRERRRQGLEWEQVRLHPYHSERILAGSHALEPVASLAGMHHERLDGSGYHRGCKARETPLAARILATADAYQAMTQPRAHRAALDPAEAAEELAKDSRAGRLDSDAVTAVLEVAGQRRPRRRTDLRPAGLSEREIEVLRLIAHGCSNHQIAERLVISRRTAEHHVQHIYTKIGNSSRPAAAVFALEHDLLN